jgi:hypothetical protein
MAKTTTWRKATEEEIAQGLDSVNSGMMLIEEIEVEQTIFNVSDTIYDITYLEQYKQYLVAKIDANTQGVIAQGFVFDGITFSLSSHAQINISNIPNIPEQAFPFVYLGKDDEYYELSFANKMNFYFTALNTVKNIRIANGALKIQVKACTTKEELDLFKQQNNL